MLIEEDARSAIALKHFFYSTLMIKTHTYHTLTILSMFHEGVEISLHKAFNICLFYM